MLDLKAWTRRVNNHKFKVGVLVAEHDLAAIRAHYERLVDPGVASIVLRVAFRIFLRELAGALCQLSII